jgi:hypothetical protein
MMYGRGRAIAAFMHTTLIVCLLSVASVAGQGGPSQSAQMSDAVFKNVQVLKGIPADEFMDTMGMFAASLGYDCTSCHSPDIKSDRAAFAVATPLIQRARQMIAVMNDINQRHFGGRPMVTCFTCHQGKFPPEQIPNLAVQYGVMADDANSMRIATDARLTPDKVFEKYLQVLGGAQRLAGLTSFIARGTYSGYNTSGNEAAVEIVARAPNLRAQTIRTLEGTNVTTYDGREAWAAEHWRPTPLMAFTGGNLEGARIDAMTAFPATIRAGFARWQVGSTTIDDRPVQVLQGTNPGQLPVNFYFDQSGLMARVVRWTRTAVGTVPTQIDYADYRDVAGVKMPFRIDLTWTNGQNTILLSEVQPNVTIDPARFARPMPFQAR